jgi:hypothetical protein
VGPLVDTGQADARLPESIVSAGHGGKTHAATPPTFYLLATPRAARASPVSRYVVQSPIGLAPSDS